MANTRINLYHYTAASNPYFVKSLAHKYGYEHDKDQPLWTVLQQLVSYEGEPVLHEIIENSPDKELFFEYFEKVNKEKENKIAEVKIHLPGKELFAKKQSRTFEEAVDDATEALRKQILKEKEK